MGIKGLSQSLPYGRLMADLDRLIAALGEREVVGE
jgi:hypothetical protein